MKTGNNREKVTDPKKELRSWIICIVSAILIALFLRTFVFEMVVVQGESMEPGLHTGNIIFTEKVSMHLREFEYGEIVVVKYANVDDRNYVKRVVGLPGDVLEIHDGTLYRNGEAVREDYLLESVIKSDLEPTVVPEDHIFVMGDNRNDSMDSRSVYVGAIPDDDVMGVGKFVLLPLDEMKLLS